VNPFRTISSTRPFVDARCAVRRDEFELDDGHRGVHLVIEIPDAVVVVPVLEDGRVLLLRQWRYTLGVEVWEVAAGRIHEGESVEAAAARELREETGHVARRLARVGRLTPLAGISSHVAHLVVAYGCTSAGPLQLEPTERIEVATKSEDEVRAMLRDGAIEDGFAIAALSRYLLRR